jgi:hypothetical protein
MRQQKIEVFAKALYRLSFCQRRTRLCSHSSPKPMLTARARRAMDTRLPARSKSTDTITRGSRAPSTRMSLSTCKRVPRRRKLSARQNLEEKLKCFHTSHVSIRYCDCSTRLYFDGRFSSPGWIGWVSLFVCNCLRCCFCLFRLVHGHDTLWRLLSGFTRSDIHDNVMNATLHKHKTVLLLQTLGKQSLTLQSSSRGVSAGFTHLKFDPILAAMTRSDPLPPPVQLVWILH